jgi:signal transduction histidine kinase
VQVSASESLREQYDRENINELPGDSFTAEAVNSGKIGEVTIEDIEGRRFAHPQIALRNNFGSMVIVPISIGQETYAVVDVFLKAGRRLTSQEKEFLEHFASRAAVAMIAIQNAKLVDSFSKISERLVDEDIELILQSITDSALTVLHANPVILFRYETSKKKFFPEIIMSGDCFFPEVRNIPKEIKENDWPNIILNLDHSSEYIENEHQYLNFQKRVSRVWRGHRFDRDFWYREQIRSFAALRLEHRDEPVGIMFVNYRSPQKFNEPTRRLIEAFAAQAASAIARNRQFWETHRRDSFSLSINEIVASLSHNAANLLNVADVRFARFENYLKKADAKQIPKDTVQDFLTQLKEPWDEILADFNRLEEYRKFDEFHEEFWDVESLIEDSLFMLRNRFEKQKITIKKTYAKTPEVLCDKHQIQHMLLNLFLNAMDAMGRRGVLSVGTDLYDRYVRIRISDTGVGIPSELHSEIFKPFFTTKKQGSGLGLPISRYIARRHRGRIDFTSRSGKESTFSIYLPLERISENDGDDEGQDSASR